MRDRGHLHRRPAEAAACADKFKANNVGVSLAVTPCWCYGSETFDKEPFLCVTNLFLCCRPVGKVPFRHGVSLFEEGGT